MDRFDGPPRLILVADLDCTLVDHDDPENTDLLKFNALWEAQYRHDSLLVYCTGRSFSSYSSLRKKRPLLTPDIAVTSVGSVIVYGGDSLVSSDDVWTARLDDKWNRDIVLEETSKFPQLEPQPAKSQEPHKVSFFVEKEHAVEIMKVLPGLLEERGVDVKLVYSNGYAFDVLPKGAGKQGALTYLLDKLEIVGKQPSNTLVCGDSGNDAELFNIPQVYGVMVSNSHEELLQWHEENAKDNPKIFHASQRCGAGIIEAIERFSLGPSVSPRDVLDTENFHVESLNPVHEVVKFYLFYERWRCGEVEKSDKYLQYLKSLSSPLGIFVHPSGEEKLIHEWIDEMGNLHGDGKEKQFRIWLDKVSSSHISSDTWVARFDKHELSEGKVRSCSTKVLLSCQGEKQKLTWMHIHQSWLDESFSDDQEKWIF
ncbi:PREDICTED: probable sucrose-phosphatase 3a [Camelina sativa]|uniref:Sucrose-phosphatase n=1 Tax=Camelina sativa TaxID=90675 RepID=A0ABM0TIZ5_CAMSA|nr:PREDICTED: probable sucrose-phosphatase 3a [Camelina sativa]